MTPNEYLEKKLMNEHYSVILEGHCKEYLDGFIRGMTRALEVLVETADLDKAQRNKQIVEKLKNSDLRVISGGAE